MMKCSTLSLLTAGLMVGTTAHAAVTYVDATMANTNNAAGGADSTWLSGDDGTTGGTIADGTATNDGLWRYRGAQGSAGIFEATGSSTTEEDAVLIVTTLSGLADGTYDIYAFFRASTSTGENYNIKAGLTSTLGNADIFRQNDTRSLTLGTVGVNSTGLTFAPGAAPSTANGETRALLYGIVGQAVVSGGNNVQVYIDDLPAAGWAGALNAESTVRTWYDGIGYEAVPEPSSLALIALGGVSMLQRRRRR